MYKVKFFTRLKPDKTLIYYISLIGFFAIFTTTLSKNPVLPLYAKSLGATDFIIGLVSALSPLAGIIFSFPIGLMSDKIGKKRLLIVSSIIFVIAPLLYLLINDAIYLIPIRFFHGMATAILGPIAAAIIVSTYPEKKGEKLGVYSSVTLIGRTIAPLIGGILISYFAFSAYWNYRAVYMTAFVFALPVFFLTMFMKDESIEKITKISGSGLLLDLKYFLYQKKILSTSLIEMATYFAFGAFETYLPIYLNSIGIAPYKIGLIFSLQVLVIALSKPVFGKLADVIDKRKQIIFGILIVGMSIGTITLSGNIVIITLIGMFFALGVSLSTIATNTYITEITRKDKIGASMGILSSIMDVGHTLGPFVTGIIITYMSIKVGFMFALSVSIATAVFFIIANRKR